MIQNKFSVFSKLFDFVLFDINYDLTNILLYDDLFNSLFYYLEYTTLEQNNIMIKFTTQNGNITVLNRLLESGTNVDPSAKNNYAIRFASQNGHIAVVDRLLQDRTGRVDPSADNNSAIRMASENGHIAVVDRLLQDRRVDPSAANNSAIRMASENGHIAVVEILTRRTGHVL